ncbi:MAG: O-antigen ligase family protein [Sneathiella sp.]
MFIIILILLAVGVVETFTGRLLINDVVGLVAKTYNWAAYPPRLGFFRVQTTFEHPILFGVFCSSGFALFYYTKIGKSKYTSGVSGASVSGFATFLSLSMGAYISVAAQIGFIIWDKTTRKVKNSWVKLASGLVALYVLIDLLSNRSPIEVIIGHIAFNSHTSYFRVHIWNFGLENVKSNPIFGLGLHEWIRPAWMPSSIDNFWLLTAMTSGIPSFLFLAFGFSIIIRRIYKLKISDTWLSNCRKGILFSIIGIFLSLCTVHVWNATFCYLMFLVGSSVWLIDYAQKQNKLSLPDQNDMEERGQDAGPLGLI